ncbi:MAG: hypothetical protein ACYSWZ_25065, partial [Planctomycetota bacterium]
MRKKKEELATKRHQFLPEKTKPAKPPVPGFPGSNLVEQGQRRGDVSRETDEAAIPHAVIPPYGAVISRTDIEKNIAGLSQPVDEIKALLKKGQSTDYSLDPRGSGDKKESGSVPIVSEIPIVGHLYSDRDVQDHRASVEKKESEGVPLLGDIPVVGGLFRPDGKKRPLTDEEQRRIVAYLEDR